LTRGKARSRAPIINGMKKLPNVVGIDGMRKNQTITMPCIVNMFRFTLLHLFDFQRWNFGGNLLPLPSERLGGL
jgi:hypothetical protein